MNKKAVPAICLAFLAIITIITGINPSSRIPWVLEAVLVWLFVVFIYFLQKKYAIPNHIYVLTTIFLVFPLIGGYYSFDNVPYGELLDFTGKGINQFDRLIHFLYGLLLAPFAYFYIKETSGVTNKYWLFALPILVLLAGGAIYEILEWSSGLVLAPDAVSAWVGIKNDAFDPHKDMLLGIIGSVIAMVIIFLKKK